MIRAFVPSLAALLLLALPAQGKDFLGTNEFIKDGQTLVAPNRAFHLMQQGDGNLCTYRGTGPGDNRGRVWCTTVTEAPARMPVCTTKGCGVAEPQSAAGTWGKHNCSGLTTPMLKAHCEERNGKWAAVEAKCAPRKATTRA